MSKYTQLLQYIQEAVYPAYGEKYSRFTIRPTSGEHRAKIHSVLIFFLEVIIYDHRKKYAQPFAPIHGIKALRHKVFTDKLASIHEIENISLECIVFALLKDLRLDNFPDPVRSALENIELIEPSGGIDLSLELNWNLGDGSLILHQD